MLVHSSAPGKVILHGEHSVVHNKLALAAAIDLRTVVSIDDNHQHSLLRIHLDDIGLQLQVDVDQLEKIGKESRSKETIEQDKLCPTLLEHVKMLTKELLPFPKASSNPKHEQGVVALIYLIVIIFNSKSFSSLKGLDIKVHSDIPVGAGLGSSAAFCVALAAALTRLKAMNDLSPVTESGPVRKRGRVEMSSSELGDKERRLISQIAFLGESILHGTPSGVDNSVSSYGGLLSFRRSSHIEMHSQRFPAHCLRVMLINTRLDRDTAHMVSKVHNFIKELPDVAAAILDAMDNIATQACTLLADIVDCSDQKANEGRLRRLQLLVSSNHGLLQALGVSHARLDAACHLCSKHGLTAKLTGAGGGGFALALVTSEVNEQQVRSATNALENDGFDVHCVNIGVDGVRVVEENNVDDNKTKNGKFVRKVDEEMIESRLRI